jgi:uncharacterized protein (DUF2344 family)
MDEKWINPLVTQLASNWVLWEKKMKTDKYWDEQVYDKDLIHILIAILCKISYSNLYDIEDWNNLYIGG